MQAEQVWYHCRKELIGGIDGVEDLDVYIPQETSDSETVFFSKSNLHNAILVLPPHVKQTLVDCLRKKGIPFHAPGKRGSAKNWLVNYFEWLLGPQITPRRELASDSPKSKAPTPAPSLAPGPGAKLSNHHAPSRSVLAPSPTSKSSKKQEPAPSRSPPKQSGKGTSPPSKQSGKGGPPAKPAKTKSPPAKPAKKKSPPSKVQNGNMTKLIAIAVAAVVIVLLVALLLCCCLKKRSSRKVNPRSGRKDDRPLLNLSSSGMQF